MRYSTIQVWVYRHRFKLIACGAVVLIATAVRAAMAGVIGLKGICVLGMFVVLLLLVLILGDRFLLLWQRVTHIGKFVLGLAILAALLCAAAAAALYWQTM